MRQSCLFWHCHHDCLHTIFLLHGMFDFDDAIFLPNPNTAWGRWSGLAARLKCPGKTDGLIG